MQYRGHPISHAFCDLSRAPLSTLRAGIPAIRATNRACRLISIKSHPKKPWPKSRGQKRLGQKDLTKNLGIASRRVERQAAAL
jgi:hypothetical protein